MTVRTISPEALAQIAFDSGQPIHFGAHEADVTVDGVMFVCRLAETGSAA